jgi:hypothetical protein
MYGWGGSASSINAQIEADRLAGGHQQEPDPAGERAERMTRAARVVIGAAAAVGFTWFAAGTAAGLVALAVAVALGLGFAVRRRMRTARD